MEEIKNYSEHKRETLKKEGAKMTNKVKIMTTLQKEFSDYEWTLKVAEILATYKETKTVRVAIKQVRLAAFNLLGVANE